MSDSPTPDRPVYDPHEREAEPVNPSGDASQKKGAHQTSVPPVSGSSGGEQPDWKIPPRTRRSPKPDPSGHVLIGPGRSGKTTLLTAIERACQLPVDDGLNLSFGPDSVTSTLIRGAYRRIAGKQTSVSASVAVNDYPFRISLTDDSVSFWNPSIEADMEIVMSDGPGGHLFPVEVFDQDSERFRQNMVERVSKATTVVLCVDVTDCNLTLLDSELSRLLAETTKVRDIQLPITFKEEMHDRVGIPVRNWKARLDHILGNKSRGWNRSRRSLGGNGSYRIRRQNCLNADRFLLLLTQIDKLCDRFPSHVSPLEVARIIDPVEQAKSLLGSAFLKRIFDSVSLNGRVAVGICSAMGFHPETGTPFADHSGKPFSWSTDPGNELLRNWTPFGVRDAIYFIGTGECRGAVSELNRARLLMTNGANEIELQNGSIGG